MKLTLSREEKLAIYLKLFISSHSDIKSQKDFVDAANKANKEYPITQKGSHVPKGLDAPTLSRIISQRTKATDKTYELIARVVVGPGATVENLWDMVDTYAFPTDPTDDTTLNLASGYTIWAGLLLVALGLKDESGAKSRMSGVQFAFFDQPSGSDEQGRPAKKPDWIENLNDIPKIVRGINDLSHLYIAERLEELMKAGTIDGFFMLRETYANTSFAKSPNDPNTPVQVCRVATGYGTHMYILGRKELLNLQPEPVGIDESPEAYEIVRQLDRLQDLFSKNFIRIYQLNNATVINHFDNLKRYRRIQKSFVYDSKITTLKLSEADMKDQLKSIREKLSEKNTLVALVGFEPILNQLYHRLLGVLPEKSTVRYEYFNLSKLTNSTSTYCLYCHPKVLQNPLKLLKINEFLSLIDLNAAFSSEGKSRMAELLFPYRASPGKDQTSSERVERVFADLGIRNNMLPFFQIMSRLLLDAQ